MSNNTAVQAIHGVYKVITAAEQLERITIDKYIPRAPGTSLGRTNTVFAESSVRGKLRSTFDGKFSTLPDWKPVQQYDAVKSLCDYIFPSAGGNMLCANITSYSSDEEIVAYYAQFVDK